VSPLVTPDKDHLKKALIAILLCVGGWFAFSVCDATSKWLTSTYSVSQIVFMSSLPITILSAFIIFMKGGLSGFNTLDLKWHIARAVSVVLTAVFVVNALKTIPLADFYGITFLSPFITALLAALFLKEHLGWHRMMAIIFGFGGVLVIAQPQFATYSIGLVFALGATLSISGTSIVLRKMKSNESLFLFSFFPSFANSIFHAPGTIQNFVMPTFFDAGIFTILTISVMVGLLLLATGLRKAPIYSVVAPFHYTQIVWGITLGYLIFGDLPTPTTLAGIGIIVCSGIYMIWREYQMHKKPSQKKKKLDLFGKSQRF
jgi:drug/metabolite transporter (DMT)-like permease